MTCRCDLAQEWQSLLPEMVQHLKTSQEQCRALIWLPTWGIYYTFNFPLLGKMINQMFFGIPFSGSTSFVIFKCSSTSLLLVFQDMAVLKGTMQTAHTVFLKSCPQWPHGPLAISWLQLSTVVGYIRSHWGSEPRQDLKTCCGKSSALWSNPGLSWERRTSVVLVSPEQTLVPGTRSLDFKKLTWPCSLLLGLKSGW